MANLPLAILMLASLRPSADAPVTETTTPATEAAPETAAAPASETEPAPAAAPLDTEVPEPSGMGLQMREYRQLEAITGLDLENAWESYEDDVREDGSTESFREFARRRFRIRRNIGIGVTCWGIAALGPSAYFWYEMARTELYEGKAALGFAAAATTSLAIGAMITGAVLWHRWSGPLRDLRDAGLSGRGRSIALRELGPIAVPRGLGLGVGFSF